jgi:hypothetical protein
MVVDHACVTTHAPDDVTIRSAAAAESKDGFRANGSGGVRRGGDRSKSAIERASCLMFICRRYNRVSRSTRKSSSAIEDAQNTQVNTV